MVLQCKSGQREGHSNMEFATPPITGLMVAFAAVAVGLAALLVLRLRDRNRHH
jgi:hypothetical protein